MWDDGGEFDESTSAHMNQNTTKRPLQSAASTHASACVKRSRAEEQIEDGVPTVSPEQHRLNKIQEALIERDRLNRLLKESNERVLVERRHKS